MDHTWLASIDHMEYMGRFRMNNICYLFDLDGTLTPSAKPINKNFADFFSKFAKDNQVFIATGSDYHKTLEQLGETICSNVNRLYCCYGNDVWENGKNTRKNIWTPNSEITEYLMGWITASGYPIKTGNHLIQKQGLVNFSVMGRNAGASDREKYIAWDQQMMERITIAHDINRLFEGIHAVVSGDLGVDIYPKGFDKSQILQDFEKNQKIIFFGDETHKGGNDWSLANNLKYPNKVYKVKNWQETYKILENI